MEEILASIRRIIADDETKPATAELRPTPAAAKPPEPSQRRSRAIAGCREARGTAAKSAPPGSSRRRASRAAAETNSQDDIDALLAGFDAATHRGRSAPGREPGEDDVFELTDEMAVAGYAASRLSERRAAERHRILEVASPAERHRVASERRRVEQPAHEPARLRCASTLAAPADAVAFDRFRGRIRRSTRWPIRC